MRQAMALLLVGLTLVACGAGERASGQQYHCPMHPTYIADRMGDCPICGMRLVPIEEGDRGPGTGDREKKQAGAKGPGKYTCPMCPGVSSDDPKARCPECGMRLVESGSADGADAHAGGHGGAAPAAVTPSGGTPAGMAEVELSEDGMRLAGVSTEKAVLERHGRAVRTAGVVTVDETRVRRVTTKIAGWVEALHVNFTGQAVRAGEPVLSLYSPELLAGQEELLRARAAAARFAASELPEVRRGGEDLVAAARRRLQLFDVPASFVAEVERTGQAQRAVTLLAPVSGFVTAKAVVEGQQVDAGMELFTVTDLSRVWIEADFYEGDATSLAVGLAATLTPAYGAGRALAGRIAFVAPTLDAATRTLRVRFECANPDLALKPGMYATVEIELDEAEGVFVPDSAVMDTGERQVVFVARGGGLFAPREVRVGARSGGRALLLAGVSEGEEVVVRANFLLDSESRLRAAIAGHGQGTGEAGHVH